MKKLFLIITSFLLIYNPCQAGVLDVLQNVDVITTCLGAAVVCYAANSLKNVWLKGEAVGPLFHIHFQYKNNNNVHESFCVGSGCQCHATKQSPGSITDNFPRKCLYSILPLLLMKIGINWVRQGTHL